MSIKIDAEKTDLGRSLPQEENREDLRGRGIIETAIDAFRVPSFGNLKHLFLGRMPRNFPFVMTKFGQLWRLVRESHTQPLLGEQHLPPEVDSGDSAITFIGHSSFLVQTGGRALLIDPVFAMRLVVLRRQRRPGVRIHDLPPIDAVLLTHAHMDHLNRPSLRAITRAMRRLKLPAPVVIVPNGVADLVRDLGFSRVYELKWWESIELTGAPAAAFLMRSSGMGRGTRRAEDASPLKITSTPARHWGARVFRDTHRGYGGYVVETPEAPTIYHSGDTAYFGGFAEIGRRLHPDVALLPIGAYFPDSYRAVHTSPEEALQGFLDLGAETMIPMHYNTFRLGREPMTEPLPRLLSAATRTGVRDRVHPLGEGESWMAVESNLPMQVG